jgi:hypothetical protein
MKKILMLEKIRGNKMVRIAVIIILLAVAIYLYFTI